MPCDPCTHHRAFTKLQTKHFMHVNKMKLRNFKCFEGVEIDCAKITLLTGANSSGKSSLLKGLLGAFQTTRYPFFYSPNGDYVNMGDYSEVSFTFISRAWCLRQPCDGTAMLTFPSYFRRERKEQPSHPSLLVTYRFDGPADDIYATLVVRLHHTVAFQSTDLWKSAAEFKTQTGTKLGFTLTRETEGSSRLEVYFEPEPRNENRQIRQIRERSLFAQSSNCTQFASLRRLRLAGFRVVCVFRGSS